MKLKEKGWVFLIILLVIVGIVAAVKFLPIYATVMTIVAAIFGGVSGWYLRGLFNKYFPKQ